MSANYKKEDYISLRRLLETELISPRQLVSLIKRNPIYIDGYSGKGLEIADDELKTVILRALDDYENKLYTEHAIATAEADIDKLRSSKNYTNELNEYLAYVGWPDDKAPKFELGEFHVLESDVHSVHQLTLNTEGRFVAILLEKAGIDVKALMARDSKQLNELLEIVGDEIDRKPLIAMLDRWRLRVKKTNSIKKNDYKANK